MAAKMREALRLRHRSIRTEKTYLQWLRSFYFFVGGKSVNDIGSRDVKNFLSVHIPVEAGHRSGMKPDTIPVGRRTAFRSEAGHRSSDSGHPK